MEVAMDEEDTAAKITKKPTPATDPGVSQLHGGITGTVPADENGGNGKWWEPTSSLEGEYRELAKKSVNSGGGSLMAALRDSFGDSGSDGDVIVSSRRENCGFNLFAPAGPLNLSLWADDHPGVLNPPNPRFRSTRNLLRSGGMPPDAGSSGITALSSSFGSNSSTPRSWTSFFSAPNLVNASTTVSGVTVGRTTLVPAFQPSMPTSGFTTGFVSSPVSSYGASLNTATAPIAPATSPIPVFVPSAPVIQTAPASTMTPMTPSVVTLSGSSGSGTTTISAPTASLPANINYQWVTVGNPGNVNDVGSNRGYGAVSYSYNIGQYDVTLAQYTVFLNAVAQSDPYNLYNVNMALNTTASGIQRSGGSGSYSYSVIGDGQRPVTFVSWFDAARFANWMQNGQPTGIGEVSASTEDGAYLLNGQQSGIIAKKAGAQVWIPTESEWYKAAYYDPSLNGGAGGYWQDATMGTGTLGNTIGNQPHQANYFTGVYSIGGSGGTTPVGAFSLSVSAYGTFDQSGDVYNWNDAVVTGLGNFRGLRGGGWDDQSAFYLMSSNRGSSDPGDETSNVGFRLAMVPEPAGWISLMTGAAMLIGRRRRRSDV
jgi:formylglycine-generating enzyme required for sulfatase activity